MSQKPTQTEDQSNSTRKYGLSGVRKADGTIRTVEHEYQYNGQNVLMELRPPTISELEHYENLDDDVSKDTLEDVFKDHIIQPKLEDIPGVESVGDLTIDELKCYFNGLLDYAENGNSLASAARDGIEERGGTAGN